jgi:hypothetical protein
MRLLLPAPPVVLRAANTAGNYNIFYLYNHLAAVKVGNLPVTFENRNAARNQAQKQQQPGKNSCLQYYYSC